VPDDIKLFFMPETAASVIMGWAYLAGMQIRSMAFGSDHFISKKMRRISNERYPSKFARNALSAPNLRQLHNISRKDQINDAKVSKPHMWSPFWCSNAWRRRSWGKGTRRDTMSSL
jgi:hypothetical protein